MSPAKPRTKPRMSKSSSALARVATVTPITPKAENRRRYMEQRIGHAEIKFLIMLIEYENLDEAAKAVGISIGSLLMVTSGLSHRCQRKTIQKVKAFFAETKI